MHRHAYKTDVDDEIQEWCWDAVATWLVPLTPDQVVQVQSLAKDTVMYS